MEYRCTTTCFHEGALRENGVIYNFVESPKKHFEPVGKNEETPISEKDYTKMESKEDLINFAFEKLELKLSKTMKVETMKEVIKQRLEE